MGCAFCQSAERQPVFVYKLFLISFYTMNYTEKGSKVYLFSIVMVAVIGGLLFGYDTAVISGAEKGLQAFFMGASDFTYTDTIHGITSSSALIGCIIGSAISGFVHPILDVKGLFLLQVFCSSYQHWDLIIPNSCSMITEFRLIRFLLLSIFIVCWAGSA